MAELHRVLDETAGVSATFLSPEVARDALVELTKIESRVAELRLRVLAGGPEVGAPAGFRDNAGWAVHQTRGRAENAKSEQTLADALDRRYEVLRRGLAAGEVNRAQAGVIATALDNLPADLDAEVAEKAEALLVEYALDYAPQKLARLGRKILEVVAPDLVDEEDARALAAQESEARRATRLSLRRCGDGTTRINGRVPDHVADRFVTYLEAFTNPRQHPSGLDPRPGGRACRDQDNPFIKVPYPRKLGEAFCQLLEAWDPSRLPLHGGDATTVVVTIDYTQLLEMLAAGDVLTGWTDPG